MTPQRAIHQGNKCSVFYQVPSKFTSTLRQNNRSLCILFLYQHIYYHKRALAIRACVTGKLEAVRTSVHRLCVGVIICFSVCVSLSPLMQDLKGHLDAWLNHHCQRPHVNITTAYMLGFSLITLLQFSSQPPRHVDFNCFVHLIISKDCNRLVSNPSLLLAFPLPLFCPHTQINRKQSLLSNEVGIPLWGVQEDIKGRLSVQYHQLQL